MARIRLDDSVPKPFRVNGKFASKPEGTPMTEPAELPFPRKAPSSDIGLGLPPTPRKAPTPSPATRGNGESVYVACAIPSGLILRLFEEYQAPEVSPLGDRTRTYTAFKPIEGAEVVLNGPAPAMDMSPIKLRRPADFVIAWPFALTKVPHDFWQAWYSANKDSDLIKNRQVFAFKTENDVKSAARELEKERTGLEQIDTDTPTKWANGDEIRELKSLSNLKLTKADKA